MNLDNEDELISEQLHEGHKKDRISYTREFLLSFSELDICTKFPVGFDQSFLSEFEGFSQTVQDRQRPPGGASLLSFRRAGFGASPPTRGDSSNSSREVPGRWGSHTRDGDSQSDWDSDNGRRYGSQRRTWQNPEHDGLLGSGSFPRTSGFSAGASAPKTRANDPGQLNRNNEPYQPPRPYKAVPHSRRDAHDSFNDETFGSSDTSEDRVEEERMRRAAFESMRKEQHKTFQEKHRDDPFSDTTILPEESNDEMLSSSRNIETNDSLTIPASHSGSSKSLLPSQSLTSRPLVPPGFAITNSERDFGTKSVVHPHPPEGTKQSGQKVDAKLKLSSEVSSKKVLMDDQSYKSSNISEFSDTIELDAEKDTGEKTSTVFSEDHSTSILEKLFDSALRVTSGESSRAPEHHDSATDDIWNNSTVQSSRFAHWFHEEEKKPTDDLLSRIPNDLLSMAVPEEGEDRLYDTKPTHQIPPEFLFGNSDFVKRDIASDITSATDGIPEQLYLGKKANDVPVALTCEDLEQSILSEINDGSSVLQPPVPELNFLEEKTSQVKSNVDNRASQHLLSLLNKGTDLKDKALSPSLEMKSIPIQNVFEASSEATALDNSKEATSQKVQDVGKTLTLETLFGTAFMNELQSFEAPVSVHRASVGPERVDIPETLGGPFPINYNNSSHSATHSMIAETGSSWIPHENTILAPNHGLQIGADKTEGRHWLGFNDNRSEVNPSKMKSEVGFNLGGYNGAVGFPEEDSLIIESAPMNHRNSMFVPAGEPSKAELLSILNRNRSGGVTEKLATLNTLFEDEMSIIEHQNLLGQPSSSQLLHSQIKHGSHPTRINAHMKFPDGIIRHDPLSNHQFSNMLHPPLHPLNALTGFDSPARHPMLQQMQRPDNFPTSHLMQGFPGGVSHPPHTNNQAAGFIRDSMQGFPFGHQRPNFGGPGMPLQGHDIRGVGNHPEALQRIMEMELRSNPKQARPLHPQHEQGGMYGHEMETGFRYR